MTSSLLLMGCGKETIPAPPPAFVGIGDVVSGATAIFSLRAYTTAIANAATQKLIKVSRDSDSATADILVATTGGLGVTANVSAGSNGVSPSTWAAGANLFLTIWYDQSGNGMDIINTTNGAQFQLFLVGGSSSGVPYLYAPGSGVFGYVSGSNVPTHAQPFSVSLIGKQVGTTNQVVAGIGGSQWYVAFLAASNTWDFQAGTDVNFTASLSAWHAAQIVFNGASSALNFDGTATSPGNCGAGNMGGANPLIVGDVNGLGSTKMGDSSIAEFALYPLGFTGTQAVNIHANQASYWGTP